MEYKPGENGENTRVRRTGGLKYTGKYERWQSKSLFLEGGKSNPSCFLVLTGREASACMERAWDSECYWNLHAVLQPIYTHPDLLHAGHCAGPVNMTQTKQSAYSGSLWVGENRFVMINPQEPRLEGGAKARAGWLWFVALVNFSGVNSPITAHF